jgi:hypothetical protein
MCPEQKLAIHSLSQLRNLSLLGNADSEIIHSFAEAEVSDDIIADGGTHQLSIGGAEGSLSSVTPEYIQLFANGDNAVCIA